LTRNALIDEKDTCNRKITHGDALQIGQMTLKLVQHSTCFDAKAHFEKI